MDPALAGQALSVIASVVGGAILVASGALFLAVLIRGQRARRIEPGEYRLSVAVHEPRLLPAALNGLGLWVGLMIALNGF